METPLNLPSYLKVLDNELYYKDINLMGLVRKYGSSLEVTYTDMIKEKISDFQQCMSKAIAKYHYPASYYYAYATKANYVSEVVSTASNYSDMIETSSEKDIELLLKFYKAGGLRKNLTIICNGTKTYKYFESIEELKTLGLNVIPTFEALDEIELFMKSDFQYEVGIRINIGELSEKKKDYADRFGATKIIAREISNKILESKNLSLKLLHFHTSTIYENTVEWLELVENLIANFYKPMRKSHKNLEAIDLGGGLPAQYGYDFKFNYQNFANKLVKLVSDACIKNKVMAPSIITEYGRYTVADSGFHVTKVTYSKKLHENLWYILKNSIMSSFPDAWALKQKFIVLPLNLWQNPAVKVKLGGITCDPDDIYFEQEKGKKHIELPEIREGETLYVAFFATGAYQQMIAGVGGTHHCMIEEGRKVIIYKERGNLKVNSLEIKKDNYIANLRYNDQEYLKNYIEPEVKPINTYVKHGKYRVVIGTEVDEKIYKKTMVLDKKVFDEFLADDSIKTIWYDKCPKLTVALVHNDTNNIVGYITCYPVKDSSFEKMLTKKITYFDLKESDIENLERPGYYNLYYFSTVVDPELQGQYIIDPENSAIHNKKVFTVLNEALVELIYELASKGVLFKTFLFDSINRDVDKYAINYNLKLNEKIKKEGIVNFYNEFTPKCFKLVKNHEKLYRYYDEEQTGVKRLNSTPLKDGFTALADFDSHKMLFILWPERPDVWRNNAKNAQETFYKLIQIISKYEKITVGVTNLNEFDHEKFPFNKNVKLVEIKHNDSWARDTGPIGLVNEKGEHRATLFGFNAYGGASDGLYYAWNLDRLIGKEMCKVVDMDFYDSTSMVLEGGSVVTNGKGTLITTKECLLNPNRNPHMTQKQIEERLKQYMGVEKIIWLNKGIYNDETDGHVDNICNFVKEDEVVLAWPKHQNDEQYAISLENYNILINSTTADGKPIKVHKLILPDVLRITDEEGGGIVSKASSQPRTEGERMAASYVNMLVSDKYVLLPAFNDSSDEEAKKLMQKIYPDKEIILFYSREILLGGGNIHCITKHV